MRKTPLNNRLGMVLARPENFGLLDRFNLRRAEFVVFPPGAREALEENVRSRRLDFSVHCPLYKEPDYPENPLLASVADVDTPRRKISLGLMERNVRLAEKMGADYMVAHLQRPCHFGGDDPEAFTDEQLFDSACESASRLDALAREAGVRVLLENQMDNPHFARSETYLALLNQFPDFGFCLDVGHLDIDCRAFGIDFHEFVGAMAHRTEAIHLQNSRGGDNFDNGRYWKVPVHPTHSIEDGWRDIPWALHTVLDANPDCVVNFESIIEPTPDGMKRAAEGVEWIRRIMSDRDAGCQTPSD